MERARAVLPDFEASRAVGELCRRLDGLPLAIELAAAHVKLLTPEAMLPRLASRLSLLTGGPRERPTRQQTLRAALDWGYDLLAEDARTLFARLAVFAGGFDLTAVERVCDGDLETFGTLVDSGLVQVRGERFALLESIREYSSERLAVDPSAGALTLEHAEYYASLGERLLAADRSDGDHAATSRLLTADVANFEAAYEILRGTSRRTDELRVAEALAGALDRVGRTGDALRILEETLRDGRWSRLRNARASRRRRRGWRRRRATSRRLGRSHPPRWHAARSTGDSWSEVTALAAIWLTASEAGDLATADDALREAEAVTRARLPSDSQVS